MLLGSAQVGEKLGIWSRIALEHGSYATVSIIVEMTFKNNF